MKTKNVYTIKSASKATGSSPQKIHRMIRLKKIKAYKPEGGWSWLIPSSELRKISAKVSI